jgi:hypothetical protein
MTCRKAMTRIAPRARREDRTGPSRQRHAHAFHEAGHLVTALALGLEPRLIALCRRTARALDETHLATTVIELGCSRRDRRSEAVVALAGALAELGGTSLRRVDSVLAGAEGDIQQARSAARRLHGRGGAARAMSRYVDVAGRTLTRWWPAVAAVAAEAEAFTLLDGAHARLVARVAMGERRLRGPLARVRAGRARIERCARAVRDS